MLSFSRYDKTEDVISEIKLYAAKNTRKQKIQKQRKLVTEELGTNTSHRGIATKIDLRYQH